jgi:hypothetical protein
MHLPRPDIELVHELTLVVNDEAHALPFVDVNLHVVVSIVRHFDLVRAVGVIGVGNRPDSGALAVAGITVRGARYDQQNGETKRVSV